ncbi:uncharacterized protein A4U43_C05F23340 [Asparagus officinalis]|uniref:Uncharacterized protein n=1 Tax=Asparagus officinalis TaxID=4686 RepID=A0A5P1ETV4_ASPOF|nr:uncharacterized protein LOC109840330 isoform X2 [Asparagus officinalis]XP_020264513.1 uncharacterized protein LOC109840330 isoform X2 [Asparagus officinalis]XP_020264514.1 uncharacterized protein LOC109840330 isoform X2 [Asparagus officinalis]XP_020264515.1 uncharacterized protein LOC109840330 isoform X2 [Asparagus officinalis]XP_020264516.1 uncharacterized protein LOC109840330 isoform X2 [Asparagus officinalis]XP_020264517.1 uncharacterized protein LOC109840330 isoform X2 [Asparagus offici
MSRSNKRQIKERVDLSINFANDVPPITVMASKPELIKHRHYDPSMSKRTRKPQLATKVSLNRDDELPKESNSINNSSDSSLNQEDDLLKEKNIFHQLSLISLDQDDELQKDDNGIPRSSLKELMNHGNGREEVANTETNQGDEIGGEMTAAISEDKNGLALVPIQGEGGVKRGGMMSRYVKVLSHFIKAKHSKKKTGIRLLKP